MKKYLLLMILLVLVLTGCSNKQQTVGGNAGVFDYKEYNTIDEMNTAVGTNIVNSIEDIKDESFGVISDNLAQYKFKINDEDWCVRASKDVDNDISGLYYDSITFTKDINSTFYLDDVYMFRFFNNDIQYVISLDTKDKEISTIYFDGICNQIKTDITGVKSGYESEVLVEGDDVVLKTTIFNDDGTSTIMETIYTFKEDKMISITNKTTFETEKDAKDYLDLLAENGRDINEFTLEGSTLISVNNSNVDFYSDYTKDSFFNMMQSSMN